MKRTTPGGMTTSKLLEKAAAQINRSKVLTKRPSQITNTRPIPSSSSDADDSLLRKDKCLERKGRPEKQAQRLRNDVLTNEKNTVLSSSSSVDSEELPTSPMKSGSRVFSMSPLNESDEIQAYLSTLSKRTRTQTSSPKEQQHPNQVSSPSLSDLSLSEDAVRDKLKAKSADRQKGFQSKTSTPVSGRVQSARVATALQKAVFFQDKYLKSKSEQMCFLVESDSDSSLRELISHHEIPKHEELKSELVRPTSNEIGKYVIKEPVKHGKSSLLQLHNLHTVDELQSFSRSTNVDKSDQISSKSASLRVEKLKSNSISDVSDPFEKVNNQMAEDMMPGEYIVYFDKRHTDESQQEVASLVESISSLAVISEHVKSQPASVTSGDEKEAYNSDSFESDSSENVLKNVYLDSVGDVAVSNQDSAKEGVSFSPDRKTVKPPSDSLRSLKKKTETRSKQIAMTSVCDKQHNDVATQTVVGSSAFLVDLLMNPPLLNYAAELEPIALPTTVTRYVIKQETLEALVASSPGVAAVNDLMRHQLVFTRHFAAIQRNLYLAQINALGSNYEYTTWHETMKYIRSHSRNTGKTRRVKSSKKSSNAES